MRAQETPLSFRLSRQSKMAPLATMATTWLRNALIGICLVGNCACNEQPEKPGESIRTESGQQVKKLREDNELEFQDLRGRWLAAKGELIRLRTDFADGRSKQVGEQSDFSARLERIEASLIGLSGDIETVRREVARPPPPDDRRERLARSYEEVHCLRKRNALDAVEGVYRRYGFDTLEDWAAAWTEASRDEEFERTVSARVERLCP